MDREITIVVTDDEARRIDARVASGEFQSTEDVVRAALASFDSAGEDPLSLDIVRQKVAEALADPSPALPANEVFEGLRAVIHAEFDAAARG